MKKPRAKSAARTRDDGKRSASRSGQVQSLTRALSLLGALAEHEPGLTLSETAQTVRLPLSTVHRLLTTLQDEGYVRFDRERGAWQIGVQAFIVGSAFVRSRDIVATARPVMRKLMDDSGETSNLAVADQGEVIYLAQVESREMMRALAKPGARVAMHCSALGKAVLAHWPEPEIRKFMDRRGLPRLTARTITSPARLAEELERVRRLGYAVDDEEHAVGLRCVAAAIFDETGHPVAALSLSGPMARVTSDRIDDLGRRVRAAAKEITAAFGGRHVAA